MSRRFDPLARARDFPRERSPRRPMPTINRRIAAVEKQVVLVADIASQPEAQTLIEVVTSLPEPTSADIGRRIILLLPETSTSAVYDGILLPNGTVTWQVGVLAPPTDTGAGGSLSFSFLTAWVTIASGSVAVESRNSFRWFISSVAGQPVARAAPTSGVYTSMFVPAGGSVEDIAVNASSEIYLAQPGNNRVRRYDTAGTVLATTATSASFAVCCVSGSSGRVFATAPAGNAAYRLNATSLNTVWTISTGLSNPQGICEDSSGNVYICNTGNNTIRKYSSTPTFVKSWGAAGTGNGQFSGPTDIFCDPADRIYVCDTGNNRIQVFDVDGNFVAKFGVSGTGPDQFSGPNGVSGDGSRLFTTDSKTGALWQVI